ncbi:hypothetical protein EQO05_01015 [Methanosarcina sp. MSH10X1]|uniref:tyrosine-type recombinase/integrase n=1 Tax=Methanosarcina sp. MSH10X1 TaxID=2507075 RepID=UPI000FFB2B07|nr:tyrosine-type recombinase/integrase [Methanosarcina sp. MSH10X1]RXA21849.1 hypothetical protein EQO05_01015 [Methanosarcina sp. MSH10X1]
MGRIFEIEELKKDEAVKDWFTLINPKPMTRNSYLQSLKGYCDFLGKAPSELIEEADTEAEKGILLKRRTVRRHLLSYIEYLNQCDISQNTIKLRLAVVKSFYKKLDVELPNLPRSEKEVAPLEENVKIPSKEDLISALNVCDALEKAVLLVGVSSGLSANEIRNLKIKDLVYDPETEITTIEIRRGKTQVDFVTFLSPEASRAVRAYLDFRQKRVTKDNDPNRERQLEKQRIFSNDGYLFILSRIPDTWLTNKNEEERKLKRNTFMEIYRSIALKAKMNSPKNSYTLVRAHNLRRYFYSTLINAGCDHQAVEVWMGHKLNKVVSAYLRLSVEDQKKLYARYCPYLTLTRAVDIVDTQEWRNLKDENQRLKALAEKYFVDGLELMNAKMELRRMQIQAMPEEERNEAIKQDIIDFVKEMKPKNESQSRFKAEMGKIMKIDE